MTRKITPHNYRQEPPKTRIRSLSDGFTIFELLIVIGIGSAMLALVMPAGASFYRRAVADEVFEETLSVLRTAERSASLGKYDRPHGVKFLPTEFVIFQGDSFASRIPSEDQIYAIPTGTTISGATDEIVFARGTGTPSATGTISVSLYERTRSVIIRDNGLVEYAN
jgi:type II secretory pathway pseudopilin PulG